MGSNFTGVNINMNITRIYPNRTTHSTAKHSGIPEDIVNKIKDVATNFLAETDGDQIFCDRKKAILTIIKNQVMQYPASFQPECGPHESHFLLYLLPYYSHLAKLSKDEYSKLIKDIEGINRYNLYAVYIADKLGEDGVANNVEKLVSNFTTLELTIQEFSIKWEEVCAKLDNKYGIEILEKSRECYENTKKFLDDLIKNIRAIIKSIMQPNIYEIGTYDAPGIDLISPNVGTYYNRPAASHAQYVEELPAAELGDAIDKLREIISEVEINKLNVYNSLIQSISQKLIRIYP